MATATIPETATTPPRAKGPLTPDQRDLAERHLTMAENLAQTFAERFAWLSDDFHSAASWALLCAARDYDASLGFLFGTYARYRIRGALLDVQRDQYPRGYKRSRGPAPKVGGLDEFEAEPVVRDSPGDRADARLRLAAMIGSLPPRQRRAMTLSILAGLDPPEVAEEMGLPADRVAWLIDDGVAQLRAKHHPGFDADA